MSNTFTTPRSVTTLTQSRLEYNSSITSLLQNFASAGAPNPVSISVDDGTGLRTGMLWYKSGTDTADGQGRLFIYNGTQFTRNGLGTYLMPSVSDANSAVTAGKLGYGDIVLVNNDSLYMVNASNTGVIAVGADASTFSGLVASQFVRSDIDSNAAGNVSFTSNAFIRIPIGTDGDRPGTGIPGMLRFNTTSGSFEGYDGIEWGKVGGGIFTDDGTYVHYVGGANVGIGITTPEANLHVAGTGNILRLSTSGTSDADGVTLRFDQRDTTITGNQGYGGVEWSGADVSNDGVRGYIKGFAAGESGEFSVRISTQGSGASSPVDRLSIWSSGNVGIGVLNANTPLQVAGNISVSGGDATIFNRGANYLALGTNNREALRITPSGNLAYGTSSPSTNVQFDGTGAVFKLQTATTTDNNGVTQRFHQTDPTITLNQGYGGIEWEGSDAEGSGVRGYLKGFGEGSSGEFGVRIGTQGAGASAPVDRLVVNAAGSVGIGTVTPTTALQVVGVVTASGAVVNTVDVLANDWATLLSARANDYATLLAAQANDFATLTTARANDYSTYLAALANDGVTLATARGNDHSTLLSAQANDWATLLSARANDYTTYLAALANDGVTLATARGNDHATLLSARANDYTTYLAALANDGVTLATARGNDHSTLLSAQANDGATLLSARANDFSTFTSLSANDGVTLATARGNDHATLLSAQANDGVTLLSARANDFSTFTTLTANVYDTYQILRSNQGSANTTVYIDGALYANSALILQAGNGFAISGNAYSNVITFTPVMSNVTSQEYTATGTSNVFVLPKTVANNNMLLVIYNGLVQKPAAYTIVGTTLTLSNSQPIDAGSVVEVRYFDFFSQSAPPSSPLLETSTGYTSGGHSPNLNTIDKFPFASNANASDVGDLTQGRRNVTGQSSLSHGYTSGGVVSTSVNTIDKFLFATNSNATDVGDLTQPRSGPAGQSSTSSGYTSGGSGPVNTIDKFPFAADGNAGDVGDLTVARYAPAGQSSSVSGYTSGGFAAVTPSPTVVNTIDKFPFASNSNATDVGDLFQARDEVAGQSSTVSGYTSGGRQSPPVFYNTIDKFPFASNANATDVGDLTVARRAVAGQSSTVSGYTSGGYPNINTIDKFPFASDGNATDVGDLTVGRDSSAGQQI